MVAISFNFWFIIQFPNQKTFADLAEMLKLEIRNIVYLEYLECYF